jgi:hypothetical protein
MAYQYLPISVGCPLQRIDIREPIDIQPAMADSFPALPAENVLRFVVTIGLRLLSGSGNLHTATNSSVF